MGRSAAKLEDIEKALEHSGLSRVVFSQFLMKFWLKVVDRAFVGSASASWRLGSSKSPLVFLAVFCLAKICK